MHSPYQVCVLKELNGWRVRYDHKRNAVIIMRSLRVSVDRIKKYEPSIWPRSPWVLRSSVDRAPPRCLGGHRFHFCRGLRFFSLSHAHDMLIISSTQDKHINPRIKDTDLAICYTSRVFLCPCLCAHVCFVRSGRCSSGVDQSTKSSEVGIIVVVSSSSWSSQLSWCIVF